METPPVLRNSFTDFIQAASNILHQWAAAQDPDIHVAECLPGACWVCGAPADSKEHRFKKSDLVSQFGRGPYRGVGALAHLSGDGDVREIQGPNAELLKYKSSLCSDCNNRSSQPHDRAYATLMTWLFENEALVCRTRSVDLKKVFPIDTEVHIADLLRYYCKSLGCRIHDSNRPVPRALATAVQGGPVPRSLKVSFAIDEYLLSLRNSNCRALGKSALWGNLDPAARPFYRWAERVSWVTAFMTYRQPPELLAGTVVQPSVGVITLGHCSSRPSDESNAQS